MLTPARSRLLIIALVVHFALLLPITEIAHGAVHSDDGNHGRDQSESQGKVRKSILCLLLVTGMAIGIADTDYVMSGDKVELFEWRD